MVLHRPIYNKWKFSFMRIVKISTLLFAVLPSAAICAEAKKPDNSNNSNFKDFLAKLSESELSEFPVVIRKEWDKGSLTPIRQAFDEGVPVQTGYGFLMGYSSGYCLKKVSRVVSFFVGGVFILLQTLSYTGHISINYEKVQKDIEKSLDLNQDGKLDSEDAKQLFDKTKTILGNQIPAGSGFAAGLLMGLRK